MRADVRGAPTETEDAEPPQSAHRDLVDRVRPEVETRGERVQNAPEAQDLQDLVDDSFGVVLLGVVVQVLVEHQQEKQHHPRGVTRGHSERARAVDARDHVAPETGPRAPPDLGLEHPTTQLQQVRRKDLERAEIKHLHRARLVRVDEDDQENCENHAAVDSDAVDAEVPVTGYRKTRRGLHVQMDRVVLDHGLRGFDAPVHHLLAEEEVDDDERNQQHEADNDGGHGLALGGQLGGVDAVVLWKVYLLVNVI